MNFVSSADLYLDYGVSLILRRKAFFQIILVLYIVFENIFVQKKIITHFQALKNTPQNQTMGTVTFFYSASVKWKHVGLCIKLYFILWKYFYITKFKRLASWNIAFFTPSVFSPNLVFSKHLSLCFRIKNIISWESQHHLKMSYWNWGNCRFLFLLCFSKWMII